VIYFSPGVFMHVTWLSNADNGYGKTSATATKVCMYAGGITHSPIFPEEPVTSNDV
jgi:hypothetical protein